MLKFHYTNTFQYQSRSKSSQLSCVHLTCTLQVTPPSAVPAQIFAGLYDVAEQTINKPPTLFLFKCWSIFIVSYCIGITEEAAIGTAIGEQELVPQSQCLPACA